MNRKDPAEPKDAAEDRVPEKCRLPQEMERASRRCPEEEDVEHHVGVVRREDHRALRGDALGILDDETAMEQVGERSRERSQQAIEEGVEHRRFLQYTGRKQKAPLPTFVLPSSEFPTACRRDSYAAGLWIDGCHRIGVDFGFWRNTWDDLKQHVVKKIGAIARPDDIIITADLPKTRSGKIMRRLLRDIAEGKALGDTTTLADPAVVEKLKEKYADEA